jgi:hypothetical protein
MSETRGLVSSVTAVVTRIQMKDIIQSIERAKCLYSVCLNVCVLLDPVSSEYTPFPP